MRIALILINIILMVSCKDSIECKYMCLPPYKFEIVQKDDNQANYHYFVDTTLYDKSVKFEIEFVWSTGDTGILHCKKAGRYVCSIKGKYTGNCKFTAPDSTFLYQLRTFVYCYHGNPTSLKRDSIYNNGKWYYSEEFPRYDTFESGLLDTIEITHLIKPIKIGAQLISKDGKIITLNQWYYRRLQGLE